MVARSNFSNGENGEGAFSERKLPERQEEAERKVVASAVMYPDQFLHKIQPEFLGVEGRAIYDAAKPIFDREGRIDTITLITELRAARSLERAGGTSGLMELPGWSVTTVEQFEHFHAIIRRAHYARRKYELHHDALEKLSRGCEDTLEVAELHLIAESGGCSRFKSKPTTVSDLIATQFPGRTPLISDLFYSGEKLFLTAGSKAGKTWTLIDLALSVSTGVPFWGMTTTATPVLFVNLEVAADAMKDRIQRVTDEKGVGLPDCLHIWNARGELADISEMAGEIIRYSKENDIELIIVDPVYKIMPTGKSESSDELIREFTGWLDKISRDSGAAMAISHHHPKGQNVVEKDILDRGSGSGVWGRDADVILDLIRHNEEGCYVVGNVQRNRKSLEEFVVRFEFPLFAPADELSAEDVRRPNGKSGNSRKYELDDILIPMPDKGVRYNEWYKAVQAGSRPMGKNAFNKLRQEAVEGGFVTHDKHLGTYTNNGIN